MLLVSSSTSILFKSISFPFPLTPSCWEMYLIAYLVFTVLLIFCTKKKIKKNLKFLKNIRKLIMSYNCKDKFICDKIKDKLKFDFFFKNFSTKHSPVNGIKSLILVKSNSNRFRELLYLNLSSLKFSCKIVRSGISSL